MNKFPLIVFILMALVTSGCFPKSSSNKDQIATGVAKTVAAQNAIVPDTGADVTTPPTKAPTAIPPTAAPKVKPTVDYRQAALPQILGTWKVNRVNKSSRGMSWQDLGNRLTFQEDGTMVTETPAGVTSNVKFRLDIKVIVFTFEDGHKEYWNFSFPSGNDSLTITKQGGTERVDLLRVQ
jgi:hypothetical protein